MPIYETSGHLTDHIPAEGVSAAQEYLQWYDKDAGERTSMEQYLDPMFKGVIESLDWYLDGDGYNYTIRAYATRELTDAELKKLSEECSGQNSDGLGEGFEQQDFAWVEDDGDEDCSDCDGTGTLEREDEGLTLTETCDRCGGDGYYEREDGHMISFDWETNKLPWKRIK